jgi:translation initiation factor 2 alpha subunit (eIF-2alpha)
MDKQQLEIGDIVMCTVDRIVGTIVFVKIDNNGTGSIILSEVAPGRIRNLRDYIVPKKRIICKVLRITQNNVDLSLRRVTPKEQKEVREQYSLEKSYQSILTTFLKEKAKEIIEKISESSTLYQFFEKAKENPKEFEELVGKENATKILAVLKNQKSKKIEIKKEFNLSSTNENGLTQIKNILENIKEAEIKYISAGKYSIKISGTDPKKAENTLKEILEKIEKTAKIQDLEFNIK